MAQGLYDISALEPYIREGRVLLTPNSRLARRITSEWNTRCVAAGEQTWESPTILPLESWLLKQWEAAVSLGRLPALIPLSAAQEIELWRQVISAQEQAADDYHLMRPGAAAEIAKQSRDSLVRWQVDLSASAIRQAFTMEADCDTFLRWLDAYETRLAATGQCALVDCFTQVATLQGVLPVSAVALVEFDELQPLMHTTINALSTDIVTLKPRALTQDKKLYAFRTTREELQTVALWAATLHRADPSATIGIVLSDMANTRIALEYLLRKEFDCLGASYNDLPVNFSAGMALAQVPLVRTALAVLLLGQEPVAIETIVKLLHSRFIDLTPVQRNNQNRLITRLFQNGQSRLSLQDLHYVVRSVLRECNAASMQDWQSLVTMTTQIHAMRAMPAADWVTYFRQILAAWGWPGKQGIDSLEYQQLELWNRTLDEFKGFDAVCRPLGFHAALRLLQDISRRQIFQPQTDDGPVQVLGTLEAAGLSFTHLWLCGMQATRWPRPPQPNPFIPVALQKRLQMPHATPEREWLYSAALVTRYAQSCHSLHASYALQVEGVGDGPSALLQEFAKQDVVAQPPVSTHWQSLQAAGEVETLADNRAPAIDANRLQSMQGGSALLEDQSQCPFRAFARRRLQAQPLPMLYPTLSPAERGALLHAALYALWDTIADWTTLGQLDGQQERALLEDAVATAIRTLPARKRQRLGSAFWQLERQTMQKQLLQWLAIERERSPFKVAALEQSVALQLAQLPLQLRVDRIDQLPDGSHVIIDYKSGHNSTADWFGSRPPKPQLPLYAIAEPESITAIAFAQVRSRARGYIGLGQRAIAPGISTDLPCDDNDSNAQERWQAMLRQWQEHLEGLAQSFVAGVATVDPLKANSCDWCGLQPLCRIDKHGAEDN